MKINILPKFHIKEYEDDLKDESFPFYRGKSKFTAFLINNALYWVSFLITLGLLLFLASYFKFAPFGDNSMFVMDGAYFNLPVLTDFIHSIEHGTFHFFTLNGSAGSEYFSTILFYLCSPFTLITLLFHESTAVSLLTIFTILRIAFSAPFMIYYLTHRENGRRGSKYDPSILIFALGYSLSTYSLIQYNDFMYIDIFMLFPLFLLGIERIQSRGSWKYFYTIASICLFSNFYLGISILIIGILIYFFQSKNKPYETCKNFVYYLLACILALGTSSITVIPGLIGIANRMTGSDGCPLFLFNIEPLNLFLQQLFFCDPSYLHTVTSSCNIYIGIFALMLVFIHFLNTQKSSYRRIVDLIFFVIMVGLISISSLQFYLHILYRNMTSFNNYCFVIFAVLIIWGFEAFKDLRKIPLFHVLISCLLPIGITLLAMNFSSQKPNFQSITYSVDLFILYTILILLYRLGSIKRESFYTIVVAIALVELFANAFQTQLWISKEETKVKDVLVLNKNVDSNTIFTDGRSEIFLGENTPQSLLIQLNSRNSNNLVLSENAPLSSSPLDNAMANIVKQYVTEDSKEYIKEFPNYKFLKMDDEFYVYKDQFTLPFSYLVSPELKALKDPDDYVAKQNKIAKSLGANTDLFQSVDADFYCNAPDNVSADLVNKNVFSFMVFNEDENKPKSYNIDINFIPKESGDFYYYLDKLVYFGKVEAGNIYTIHYYLPYDLGVAYNIGIRGYLYSHDAEEQIKRQAEKNECEIKYKNSNTISILTESDTNSTLLTSIGYSDRYVVKIDGKKSNTAFNYNGYMAIPLTKGRHTVLLSCKMWPIWTGILLSLFNILIVFAFVKEKYHMLVLTKVKTGFNKTYIKIFGSIKENYVYVLAFVLPFLLYLIGIFVAGSEPFGSLSIFSNDGLKLEIPTLIDNINHFKQHFPSGIFSLCDSCLTFLLTFKFIYCIVPVKYLTVFLTFITITKISLSGVSLVFYLTHRLQGTKANKKDIRLLFASLSYCMCNYMIIMIGYWSWYIAFLLLPFVFLGMDYLMVKGKKRYYILCLGLCVFLMYYVSVFICLYLVIRFFTYHFDNIKDFIRKGIRFTLCSLSVLGLCFFILYSSFTLLVGSTYLEKDSKFPSWYFFNGFDVLINKLGFLQKSSSVSWNEGEALLYFGILPLFLFMVYVFSGKVSWKEKLRQLLPCALLFFTMNNSILNYIMNGMHYQHGVPNRFAFILIILSAIVSYDALKLIKKENIFVLIFAFISLVLLLSISYWLGDVEKRSTLSYGVTLAVLVIYFLIFICYRYRKLRSKSPIYYLLILFCLELVINTCYQYKLNCNSVICLTYEQDGIQYVKEQTNIMNTPDRISVIYPNCESFAQVTPIKTLHKFVAGSITPYEINMGKLCSYSSLANVITLMSTPIALGNALADCRYLLVNDIMNNINLNYAYDYDMVAQLDRNIILKSKYAIPYGYYLPNEYKETYNETIDPLKYWNKLCNSFVNSGKNYVNEYPLFFDTNYPEYSKYLANRLREEAGLKSLQEAVFKKPYISNRDLLVYGVNKISLVEMDADINLYGYNIVMPEDGNLFYKISQMYNCGILKKGEIYDTISTLSTTEGFKKEDIDKFYVVHEELTEDICRAMSKNELQVEASTDTTLKGTIDMPEDGIVCISTPYDKKWHAYVDGKEVKTNAVANAFLSFEAKKGHHEIYLETEVKKSYYIIITIVSWILFIVCCVVKDKKQKIS